MEDGGIPHIQIKEEIVVFFFACIIYVQKLVLNLVPLKEKKT